MEYYRRLIAVFPGDAATRAIGALLRSLNLALDPWTLRPPAYVSNGFLQRLYGIRAAVLQPFDHFGPAIWLLVFAVVASIDIKVAVFVALVVVIFGTIPAVQYQPRHVFHLEFMSLWAMSALLSRWRSWSAAVGWRRLARSSGLVALAAVSVTVSVAAARWAQQQKVTALLGSYAQAPRDRSAQRKNIDEQTVRFGSAETFALAGDADVVRSGGVAVDLGSDCDFDAVPVTFRYLPVGAGVVDDFSTTVEIPVSPSRADTARLVVAPNFEQGSHDAPEFALQGVDVPTAQVNCVRGVWTIDVRSMPIVIQTLLPRTPDVPVAYETLARWERPVAAETWQTTPTYGLDVRLPRSMWTRISERAPTDGFSPLATTPTIQSRITRIDAHGRIEVSGSPETPGCVRSTMESFALRRWRAARRRR